MKFSVRQLEAMRIVKSDLDFIKREWNDQTDNDSLRRYSVILRQLLVDEGGLVQKVVDWLKINCFIQASPDPLLKNKLQDINFFAAGGGSYRGLFVQDVLHLNRALSDEEVMDMFQLNNGKPILKKYTLEQYLSVPCIIYDGEVFSRIELIKFISNKLGGAHYELEERKMARMKSLNEAKDHISVADKSSVYFEFLSIGQALNKSKYIDRLKKKIRVLTEN